MGAGDGAERGAMRVCLRDDAHVPGLVAVSDGDSGHVFEEQQQFWTRPELMPAARRRAVLVVMLVVPRNLLSSASLSHPPPHGPPTNNFETHLWLTGVRYECDECDEC